MKDGSIDRLIPAMTGSRELTNMEAYRDRSGTAVGTLQTKNIKAVAKYLAHRVKTYTEVGHDIVNDKDIVIARFRSCKIDNEFLAEIQIVQLLITSLSACSVCYSF